MSRSVHLRIDESELPILVVRYPAAGTLEDLEAAWDVYRRVAAENDRVAYLIDMREFNPASQTAATRKRAGELHALYSAELAPSAVCEARVVSNRLVQGILVAFDWIKGDALWPCRNFSDMTDARLWIDEQLARSR